MTCTSGVRLLLGKVRYKQEMRMSRTIGKRCKRGKQPLGIMLKVIDVMMMEMIKITVLVLDVVVMV